MRKQEIRGFIFLTFIILVVIVWFSYKKYSDTNFIDGILVEVHGMIIDFFIVSILLSSILASFESKKEIQELHQIIDFQRLLNTEESKHKIQAAIKALNSKKITIVKLHQCKLNNLTMSKIKLRKSSIHATDFSHSNINNSDLSHCNGEGVKFLNTIIRSTNFACTTFYRMEMHNARGKNCDFTQATIIKSNILGCDLEGSDFRQAKIHKTNFTNSIMTSVDFRGSDFESVDFSGCCLKNAKFHRCSFNKSIIFVDADLSKSNFSGHVTLPLNELILAKSLKGAFFEDVIKTQLQDMGANL